MRKLYIFVMIVCIIAFLVSAFFLGRYLYANMSAEKSFDELRGGHDGKKATLDYDKYEKRREQLEKLKNCEAHSTVILSSVDESTMKKLGINITYEPRYETEKFYHK